MALYIAGSAAGFFSSQILVLVAFSFSAGPALGVRGDVWRLARRQDPGGRICDKLWPTGVCSVLEN